VRYESWDSFRDAYTRDISHGGIFVHGMEAAPAFSKVLVVLQLPGDKEIQIGGEVVHSLTADQTADPDRVGVGIHFSELDQDTTDALERYISGLPEALPETDFHTRTTAQFDLKSIQEKIAERDGTPAWDDDSQVGASGLALLNLDDEIKMIEQGRDAGDPYRIIGVRPSTSIEVIRGVYDARRHALSEETVPAAVPPAVRTRVALARKHLDDAWTTLSDPPARARCDVTLRHLRPPNRTSAEREALRLELARRREEASPSERSAWAEATRFADKARESLNRKDPFAARNRLRMALLYDPYSPELHALAEEIEAAIAERMQRKPA